MVGSDVIIVGGGILGLRIATEMSARGQSVSLISDGGLRASDASLVWLNVISTEEEDYARLRSTSMGFWAEIMARDATCPVKTKGALLWDRGRGALEDLCAFQNGVGWPVEIIGTDQFRTLAPGIVDAPEAAIYAPGEAAGDPAEVMHWAEAQADVAGVNRIAGHVAGVEIEDGRAVGIRFETGDVLDGNGIVLANAFGQTPLLEPFSVDPGLRDAPGMLLRTAPLPKIAGPILASPLMDFWQDNEGRVLVATGTHQTMVDDLKGSAARALVQLASLAPAAKDAEIETLALRQRPIPGDGGPIIGDIPGVEGLWMALTHSGMTLAPVIARGISDMVLGERPSDELAPFTPSRMVKG